MGYSFKWKLELLAILNGGGHTKVLSCLEGRGGGANSFRLAIFPFCSPSPLLMTSPLVEDGSCDRGREGGVCGVCGEGWGRDCQGSRRCDPRHVVRCGSVPLTCI